MKQSPALLSFARSMLAKRDAEARKLISRMLSQAYRLREMFSSTGIDASKFKNPADAARASKMTAGLSQGCAQEWSRSDSDWIDNVLEGFNDCMDALKRCFYKEEYL